MEEMNVNRKRKREERRGDGEERRGALRRKDMPI